MQSWCQFILLLSFITIVNSQSPCQSPSTACTCYIDLENKKNVVCRYKGLTSIPSFTDTGITYDKIDFGSVEATGTCSASTSCNNITSLGANAFRNLRVKEIDLLRNGISTVDVDAFLGLENVLESLLIEGDGTAGPPYQAMSVLNVLNSLHLENFNQVDFNDANTQLSFPTLKTLVIENFKFLRTMTSQAFVNIPNIETFKLNILHNMTSIPVLAILGFSNLKSVTIHDTSITQVFGQSFHELQYLTSVEISSNRDLEIISDNAFEVVSNTITFLSLFQNKLNSLDFLSRRSWPKLTQLNVGYNFVSVPSGAFSTMPNLNYLTMADMAILNLSPGMLTGLTNLHTLDLGFNQLQTIPENMFQNTPNLVDLRLNNQNENIAGRSLTFANNAFQSIQSSLQHLQLEKNRFTDITQLWTNINKFVNLIDISLANIGLHDIPDYAFQNNVKLESIDLSVNNISSVKPESFFGPRDTLKTINLASNQITVIDKCVLYLFPTQPEIFITNNLLHCDCQLKWLYQWVLSDQSRIYAHVGPCTSPPSLKDKYFVDDFNETALTCPPDYQEPTCRDLYITTTTTTTSTTTPAPSTTTTPVVTKTPTPSFTIDIIHKEATKITLVWDVSDRTYVTEYKLEIIKGSGEKTTLVINKEETEKVIDRLIPETFYQFCLILQISGEFRENEPKCTFDNTLPEVTDAPVGTTPKPEAQMNIGLVAGLAVGGLVLVVLVILIIVFILKSKKPKKRAPMTQPISFSRAEMPHAGDTAKRHAKKAGKADASPDEITVNVISSGSMNNERMSAGSYQYLKDNEKSVNSNPNPNKANGHYMNDIESRALPRNPQGVRGNHNHGYVNDSFLSGATNFPETSLNTYSEVVN